ncbi:MAG: 2-oxo acid dehydrogenase subunit E2 [Cytophagales bacterium]|nr:2-oxo acid dehydrogenase subunit E2 [Armatimonadota bacterium]
MAEVIMPKMGDAMDEGKIVQWLKKVGDSVKADDAIVEIETDKSNAEVPADSDGVIQSLSYEAGESVPVGTVIAVIGNGVPAAVTSAPPAAAPVTPPPPAAAAPPPPVAKSNGSTPATETAPRTATAAPVASPVAVATPVAFAATTATDFKSYDSFVGAFPENLGGSASLIGAPIVLGAADTAAPSSTERVKATPVARAMAQANQVDLATLRGTGPDGAVGKADVEAALAGGSPVAQPVSAPPTGLPVAAPVSAPIVPPQAAAIAEGDEVQEYNAMRRTIAKRLTESKQTIPHFYVTAEIDIEAMFSLREQVNASVAEGGTKVSVNDFLVKAVAVALVENPVVNSQFLDNKRILKRSVNIGIAVSVADGLIVPVVKGCESKSIRAIAKEARPLIEKARDGKLKPEDYTGGTFTISNMGSLTPDVENFAAIINPGEAAILAVSSIRTVPAVVGDAIVPRKRMKVTLCADHRVMDGAAGALFLQSLKRVIENPLQILA